MADYDPYDAPRRGERSSHRYYEEQRTTRHDPYVSSHTTSRDLVPRGREDSELSVEEIRRDFPPPGSSRDVRRSRSVEPPAYYDEYDDYRSQHSRGDRGYDRGYDRDDHRSRKKGSSVYYEEEEKTRSRTLSKQQKLIAAAIGGALAVGGKELFDRREANSEGNDVHRNPLASAALGAAGAFAAYQGAEFYNKKTTTKEERKLVVHKGRDGYYSDDEDMSVKEKKGHKNFLENALAAAGLGGAVKALTGGGGDKSDTKSRRGSNSRSRSREKGDKGGGANKIQKAAMASLIAGATEAFRVAKQPGDWKGEKAKRIFTAAAGAATIDAAQTGDKGGSKLGLAESVIGGLLGNRLVNGSKKNIEEDKKTGRSRSRSRAGTDGGGGGGVSGLAALATAGLGAFGAKKLMDNRERSRSRDNRDRSRSRDNRDRSRSRDNRARSRQRSVDSYDSRDGSPDKRRKRSRSRSVVDSARRSLAKIGLGNGPDDDRESPRGSRNNHRHYSDDDDDRSRDRGHGRRRNDYDDDDRSHSGRNRQRDRSRGGGGRDRSRGGSDTDLGSSDEDNRKAKKMRGKQILTTGLAAVATIHAAHNVYQSMEKRNARRKAVEQGRLSEEEAKKLKSKALLQDAASVGIAALGIKGAISEMKEARETQHELKEWREEKEKRHQRRLERQIRSRSETSYDDRSRTDNWASAAPRRGSRYDDGPHYSDGNPYAALPAPPVGRDRGYDDRR